MASLGDDLAVRHDNLCITPEGRSVESVFLGDHQAEPKHRVAITCRHHCCEMMTNYTMEGLIRWVLYTTEVKAEWLRQQVEFFLGPFVDKNGDQGKGRQPRDLGRDYEGNSLSASTQTIRRQLPVSANGRLRMGLDLHCLWISGEHNEVVYLVGAEDCRNVNEQRRFSTILESVNQGLLPFSRHDFLPFGRSWNTQGNYSQGKGSAQWITGLPNLTLGSFIEIPYANAGGVEVNQVSARSFGEDLGRTIAVYLQELPQNQCQ